MVYHSDDLDASTLVGIHDIESRHGTYPNNAVYNPRLDEQEEDLLGLRPVRRCTQVGMNELPVLPESERIGLLAIFVIKSGKIYQAL